MASATPPKKGNGKRPVGEMDVDNSPSISAPRRQRPAATRILRRHQHRRRNVAATVWGPQLPYEPTLTNQSFNIYKAILRHPYLFFQFATRLQPATIVDLYAIDKEFHFRFNKYSTSIIHDYASYHTQDAAYIFSWVLFPDVCISDPMLKPMDGRPHLARDIPSLRWTKMVTYRQNVVHGILTCLALAGLRVPQRVCTALMKFWLLMETKTAASRHAFLSDTGIWSNVDLLFFQLFLVKLDMYFGHHVLGHGVCELSHMLLTQKTLTTLFLVMNGELEVDYDDASDMLVRTYPQEDLDTDTHTWLDNEIENGVPEEEWGIMCLEDWDIDGEHMESPVDMAITEGIRRELEPEAFLTDFVLYGFVEPKEDANVPCPRRWRGEKSVVVPKEGWPVESVRADVIEKLDDVLLRETEELSLAVTPLTIPDITEEDGGMDTDLVDLKD